MCAKTNVNAKNKYIVECFTWNKMCGRFSWTNADKHYLFRDQPTNRETKKLEVMGSFFSAQGNVSNDPQGRWWNKHTWPHNFKQDSTQVLCPSCNLSDQLSLITHGRHAVTVNGRSVLIFPDQIWQWLQTRGFWFFSCINWHYQRATVIKDYKISGGSIFKAALVPYSWEITINAL